MKSRSFLIVTALLFFGGLSHAQDSIRVFCIYGSMPAKRNNGEPFFDKGIFTRLINLHGGHVGVEVDYNGVLSFQPLRYGGIFRSGHIFSRRPFNAWFSIETDTALFHTLPSRSYNPDSIRHLVFVIPVTVQQRRLINSLTREYLAKAPYDYAFLGMRCSSASYEVLRKAGLVSLYKKSLWFRVFTTRKFRYALYKEYLKNKSAGWRLITVKGSKSRQWDKDKVTIDKNFD